MINLKSPYRCQCALKEVLMKQSPREIQFHDIRLMRYNELAKRERDTSLLRSTT